MVECGVRRQTRSWSSAGVLFAVVLAMTVMSGQGHLVQAADTAEAVEWKPGDTNTALSGLIPAPAEIPDLGRWQAMMIPIGGYVESAEFSPDGQRIAFGDGHYVRIHQAESLELTSVLVGHVGNVRTVSWSPDGKWIASGANDGTVRLWGSDGVPAVVLHGHTAPVRCVAFNPQSQLIASASMDGTVRLWNVDGAAGAVIEGHDTPVLALAWNSDGTHLAAGDENRLIRLWTASGEAGPILEGHIGAITQVRWSPDGQWLASTSMGLDAADPSGQQALPAVRLWSSDGTAGPVLFGHRRSIRALAWGPRSERLVTAAEDRQMLLWSIDGNVIRPLNDRQRIWVDSSDVFTLDWDEDSDQILAGGRFSVRTVSPEGDIGSTRLMRPSGGKFMHLDWHPTEDLVAIAAEDSTVQIWAGDFSSHQSIDAFDTFAGRVRWSPDGRQLASVSQRMELRVWSPEGELLHDLAGDGSQPNGLSWTPDGQRLAVAQRYGGSRIRGLDGSQILLDAHSGGIGGVSFNADGTLLATAGYDTNAKILLAGNAMSEPQEVAVLEAFDGDVDSIAFSPDGQWLATGHEMSLCLWQPDGTPGAVIQASESAVLQIDWSPDCQQIVTGSWDRSVRLWSVEGDFLKEFPGHMAPCYGVSFSPDGKKLATCGWDGVARVLDVESGEILGMAIQVAEPSEESAADPRRIPHHETIAFNRAGQVTAGSPEVLEQQVVYLVEQSDGAFEILRPSDFQKRAAGAIYGTTSESE